MIVCRLRGRRAIVDDPGWASTLRNRGFTGRNIGEALSLNLPTALYLLRRQKVEIYYRKGKVSEDDINAKLNPEEKKNALAYAFLRERGIRPVWRGNGLALPNTRTFIFHPWERIDFSMLGKGNGRIVVVDGKGEGLIYAVEKVKLPGCRNAIDFLAEGKGRDQDGTVEMGKGEYRAGSGFKYGCELRVYRGKSRHAKYLVSSGKSESVYDIIARVRIARSVRKTYIQAVPSAKGGSFKFLAIRWIKL
jgi:tRNA splicing endonuclease